jgi:hypothetical protein
VASLAFDFMWPTGTGHGVASLEALTSLISPSRWLPLATQMVTLDWRVKQARRPLSSGHRREPA